MSETKVKKVNKMKIAVISLACALVLAVGGMIGIYAATQQTVGSTFTVNYSIGENVAVAVGACGIDQSAGLREFTSSKTLSKCEHGLYALNAKDDNQNFSLIGGDFKYISGVQLNRFYFENLSDTTIQVTIKNQVDVVNMLCEYATYNVNLQGEDNVLDMWMANMTNNSRIYFTEIEDEATGEQIPTATFELAEGEIKCMEIAIFAIADQNKSAHFICNEEYPLSFEFAQA